MNRFFLFALLGFLGIAFIIVYPIQHRFERMAVLFVFNGEHNVEAENLLASIKKNAKQLLPYIKVCVSDSKSKDFAIKHNLAFFEMSTINKSGTFMTRDMNFFTKRKFEAILYLLETGSNVFYIDTDIVLLSNPLSEINLNFDLNIQSDLCRPPYTNKYFCTGFMYIKNNAKTKLFFKDAIVEMIKSDYKLSDQCALNLLIVRQAKLLTKKNNISIKQFDVCKFPNGCRYFGNTDKECNVNQAIIVHNNYLVGVDNKMRRFKKNNLIFTEQTVN